MKKDEQKITVKTVIGLLIFFTALIGGTVLCIIWKDYECLIGFGFCWLLTGAGMIRALREAAK